MRKFTVRDLTFAAAVAALYAVLGYFGDIFGLTFGAVQFRFAEALTLDIVFGTLATAVAAWLTMKMPRWYLAALPSILVNLLVLPPIWAWTYVGAVNGAFWANWAWNCLTFAIGEAVVCYVLGTLLLNALPRIPYFRPILRAQVKG